MRKFGWIPDDDSKRPLDWKAGALFAAHELPAARPETADLRHLIPTILDQGNLGSCVTNAGAQAVRAALIRAGNPHALLASRLFAYYYARAISPGDTSVDSGTQIRCFFDVIRKLGYCPEAFWSYDIAKFTKMPSKEAFRQAIDQKTSIGYYRIDSVGQQRIADICTAVAAGYVVVFGTTVGLNFVTYTSSSPALVPPTDSLGGHALCVVGYRPGPTPGSVDFLIVNSWGADYGDAGYCWMSDAYLAWEATRDLWIVEHAPDFAA
jgi:C1A family cysteine protease